MENNCLYSTAETHLGVVEEKRPNISCQSDLIKIKAGLGNSDSIADCLIAGVSEQAEEEETVIQEEEFSPPEIIG